MKLVHWLPSKPVEQSLVFRADFFSTEIRVLVKAWNCFREKHMPIIPKHGAAGFDSAKKQIEACFSSMLESKPSIHSHFRAASWVNRPQSLSGEVLALELCAVESLHRVTAFQAIAVHKKTQEMPFERFIALQDRYSFTLHKAVL